MRQDPGVDGELSHGTSRVQHVNFATSFPRRRESSFCSAEWNQLGPHSEAPSIASQIRKLEFGNFGDVKPVGSGVSEMRIHFGPGYRVYFIQRGKELVILLCGGDKSSQSKDIRQAQEMAKQWR